MAPEFHSSRKREKQRILFIFFFHYTKTVLGLPISQLHTNTTQGRCDAICVAQTGLCMGWDLQSLYPKTFPLFPHSPSRFLLWNTQGTHNFTNSQGHARDCGRAIDRASALHSRCIFSCNRLKYHTMGWTNGQGDLGVHINCPTWKLHFKSYYVLSFRLADVFLPNVRKVSIFTP